MWLIHVHATGTSIFLHARPSAPSLHAPRVRVVCLRRPQRAARGLSTLHCCPSGHTTAASLRLPFSPEPAAFSPSAAPLPLSRRQLLAAARHCRPRGTAIFLPFGRRLVFWLGKQDMAFQMNCSIPSLQYYPLSGDSSDEDEDLVAAYALGLLPVRPAAPKRSHYSVRRYMVKRNISEGWLRLSADYFNPIKVYPDAYFRRMYRVSPHLFRRIADAVTSFDDFFLQQKMLLWPWVVIRTKRCCPA
ncbi:hypothetical protein BS78_05G079900 [Paspalum vaginatum]|nr:hypothetical protein BS78_05G079900 [Paspalum vaginatum]